MCLLRPESHGSLWLESSDPFAAPIIDPNYLAERADVDTMIDGFCFGRGDVCLLSLVARKKKGHQNPTKKKQN